MPKYLAFVMHSSYGAPALSFILILRKADIRIPRVASKTTSEATLGPFLASSVLSTCGSHFTARDWCKIGV